MVGVPAEPILDALSDASIDADLAARLWAGSGCQAITAPAVAVPVRLVAGVAAMVDGLDARGAGLAASFGSGGLGLLGARSASLRLPASGRASCGGAARLMPAADGWFTASFPRTTDWELVPAWLGIDADVSTAESGDARWSDVERAVARRPAGDLVEMGSTLGIACARVGEVRDARPTVVQRFGTAQPRSVRGVRVVNLASLWAGPLCADVLRRLGADVVCFESLGRPDGARATAAWFDAIHAGQRSVALDLGAPDGVERLTRLLAAADVVIEGSRPRALQQLGIDPEALVAGGRPQVWVSITGHGRDAGHAMRIGFGDDAAVAGGLVGHLAAGPVFLADAVADPLAGLVSAAAVVDLLAAGGRGLVDVALGRVAACLAPRPDDPAPPALGSPSPPVAPREPAPPFGLGSGTAGVWRDWAIGPV
jgi:hypothetical protein